MYVRTDTHRINIHRRGLGVSPQETESIFYPVFLGHVSGLPDQVPLWLDFIAVMFKGFWLLLLWQAYFRASVLQQRKQNSHLTHAQYRESL